MIKYLIKSLFILAIAISFTACKKTFDDYYARPEGLESPIYQVLESKGNFKSLLALIDKAGYKGTLSSAGYWTLFAPNDSAFTQFYKDRGISGADNVDSAAARAIVQYLLVYNAFDKERIDDYQSNAGWVPDVAFRRRTAYYTGFYTDTMANGTVVKAIQSNRNGTGTPYVASDNNNKYIPYFTDIYFNSKSLTAADYNYFYPNSQYSPFNVAGAKVLTQNIATENGVIHEINKVITPLPSIDEYLRSRPEYSEFKKIYDRYMVNFILNADATNRYRVLTRDNSPVYVKAYNSSLLFSLNNENYTKVQDNDAQQNCWSIVVPRNDAVVNYLNTVILEYFKTLENTPSEVIADFLNAHMWITPVWPSKFTREDVRLNAATDVIDPKILSNGIFYGTNKVREADVFASVFGKAYLNPAYSLMTRLINEDQTLKFQILSPNQKFTLFMMPDVVLRAAGYDYNSNSRVWAYTPPGGSAVAAETARQNLLRILNTGVIPGDLTSLTGTGIAEANNSEYIKWSNNQVITTGTQDSSRIVRVDSVKTAKNGTVYYLNGLLTFSVVNIGSHILKLGGTSAATSDFYYFSQYFQNSGVYNATTGEITGTTAGTFYTVYVPTNAAIMQAVKDGVLPGNKTTGVPVVAPTLAAEKVMVDRFILYHVLAERSLIPNGKESGAFKTLLKNAIGDVVPITVLNQPGSMQITDVNNRRSNVILNKSNNLSNRAVIHLIDNYLLYNY